MIEVGEPMCFSLLMSLISCAVDVMGSTTLSTSVYPATIGSFLPVILCTSGMGLTRWSMASSLVVTASYWGLHTDSSGKLELGGKRFRRRFPTGAFIGPSNR